MNVLLTGASGFIGSHLARALRAADYIVIESRRDVDEGTASVRADFTRDLSVRDWLPKLVGVDAVINAAGIVREHGAQTFERIHKRAPQALFTACVAAGVKRVVQISALGADRGMTRYFLSKRAADDYLATLPLEWTIVRPAMVFGPGASSSRLFEKLSRFAVVPLPGRGEQRVQPLHIDDLTEALVHLLADAATHRSRIELVGPQIFSLRDLLAGLRSAKHLSPPRFVPVPLPLVRAATHIAALNQIAIDDETLALLEAGARGDPATIRHLLGRPARPFAQ
ncbi:MAG TPA: NAD-dependent epimerase/dehydratase family protein [Steroidobacteraceae bacterium]|nr:NAD-dependent epimerase/dehydratase family protein [Steroidobacteraceae bacterium]